MNKVLETVLKNERPLNKSQIEAAHQMLNKSLNDKVRAIKEAYGEQVEKKYKTTITKLVEDFNKKIREIDNKMKKEFGSDACVRLDDRFDYSTRVAELCFRIDADYIDKEHPIFSAQEEVDGIILGMKLGENLKTEMLAIVNKINSIK